MATIKKACKGALYPKSSSVTRKLKSGGGFPDLNKDGKITKKDVLIGRGVLPKTAKKGMKVKKAQVGDSTQKKNLSILDKEMEKQQIAKSKTKVMAKPTPISSGMISKTKKSMKTGGKMKSKKCAYGCK